MIDQNKNVIVGATVYNYKINVDCQEEGIFGGGVDSNTSGIYHLLLAPGKYCISADNFLKPGFEKAGSGKVEVNIKAGETVTVPDLTIKMVPKMILK